VKLTKSQIENRFQQYIRGKPQTAPYPELVRKVDLYRRLVAQRFIARKEEDIPNLIGNKFIVSIKVDGGFTGYYYNSTKNDSFFFNIPTHRVYLGLPVANDLEQFMRQEDINEALLVGEMHASFTPSEDFSQRSTIHDLIKIRRNPQTTEDLEKVGFKVFDILLLDGKNYSDLSYSKRYKEMGTIFPKEGRASLVYSKRVDSVYAVQDFYRKYVLEQGHEGIIVRVGITAYKIKPVHLIDAAIIGVASGREDSLITSEQLATCLVALRYHDGTYQILGRVGGGLTEEERTYLWSQFEPTASKGFMYPTRDGRIYTMVKPKLVAQLKYYDIKTEHGGEPILEPSVRYNAKTNSWEMVKQMPFARIMSATFLEGQPIRNDKSAEDISDVRIKQILDLVAIPRYEKVKRPTLKPSEIIERRVFQRASTAVKKFLAIQTNKERANEYPKYVIYYLDYSSGRKSPLDRKAKITNDKTQMSELFNSWIQSEMIGTTGELKRGWKELK